MTKHNKKRNVGVIHEQLVRYIGNAVISGDDKRAQKAIGIITKHFKVGTELHEEFKLFNALINIPTGNSEVAKLVVAESKNFAKKHNKARLSNEKSSLIRDINHVLSEQNFYDIRVPNYRFYATVQSLLDSWRGSRLLEISDTAKYEHSLIEWLSRNEETAKDQRDDKGSDPLVFKVMLKKFQEKYTNNLMPNQKRIVESALLRGPESLIKELEIAKKEAKDSLVEFRSTCNNKILLEKIDRVISNIENFKISTDEKELTKTFQLLELVSELKGGEND